MNTLEQNLDEVKRIQELRAEAKRMRRRADRETKKALEDLEVYIKQYDEGLKVCPEIRQCMNDNPWLKDCYPTYWEACAS
ncbi:MAG: hypothetical protein F6K14_29220 [Symploca sp. SIO2C1]|nr:hypothetical protein [Symploca sp. SIO2C1]